MYKFKSFNIKCIYDSEQVDNEINKWLEENSNIIIHSQNITFQKPGAYEYVIITFLYSEINKEQPTSVLNSVGTTIESYEKNRVN